LHARDARARNSVAMIAGAVAVAAAISQAIANPLWVGEISQADFVSATIEAPLPTVTPVAAVTAPAYVFHAPTPGYGVNSPFGLRRLPWEPRGRMHEGVDIAAPRGLPVGATLAGTVIRTGAGGAYGRFVELRHADGLTSLYAHLGSVRRDLKAGMSVAAGEAVGLVGNTGRSTGEHLHFEIRREGRPLNPALFMGQAFATIEDLPLDAAARFSRRVRQAVVSPQAMARMMPLVASARAAKDVGVAITGRPLPGKGGRVHGVLEMGDPSPADLKAAQAGLPGAPQPYAPSASAPTPAAAPAAPLADFSAERIDTAG
jgi:hypothetical protein